MANETRTPGKGGMNRRDPQRYVPFIEDYLLPHEGPLSLRPATSAVIPPVPPGETIDRATLVTDWRMYINGPDPANPSYAPDGIGDCTIAGKAHAFDAMRVYSGHPPCFFSNDVIVSSYSACGGYVPGDPSTDNGCDEPTVLQYMTRTGMTDEAGQAHKLVAWAAFRFPANLNLLAAVLDTFGTVIVDVELQQVQEDQFNQGQPWQYVPGSPAIGGHSIVHQKRGVGYVGVHEMVTWGLLQKATALFCHRQIVEAYVVVSQDWMTVNGVSIQGLNLDQLIADMAGVE
jgi:hypothetical protein